MSKPRTLADGSLVFIRDPPKLLDGFTKDPKNPNHFIPDFVDCKFRGLQNYIRPCGVPATRFMCSLLSREVNPQFCNSCDKAQE